MRVDSIAGYLVHKLDRQRTIINERVLKGDLVQEEYRRLCGLTEGISYAIDLINDTEKRVANDEELTNE
jgi:hypothetical protein